MVTLLTMSNLRIRFIPIWKTAPTVRVLLPLVAGILVAWYVPLSTPLLGTGAGLVLLALGVASVGRPKMRLFAAAISLGFFMVGMVLLRWHLPKQRAAFIGHHYRAGQVVMATLQEPLVAKAKSYKALATVEVLDTAGAWRALSGQVVIYFKKDSTPPLLTYGSTVVFSTILQPIRSSGNPGAFDYERYAMFNGMVYQVFLAPTDYVVAPLVTVNRFQAHLFAIRQWVVETFRRYIPGTAEAGLAEALLIGYRNDLDKDLVEQYATTGVVHIIAISGMHLGLIYGVLLLLMKPLAKRRHGLMLTGLVVIVVLWLFSLLTGAAPSITRSALMFTAIVVGQCFNRRTSIYNSLALSALVLLLVNPFNLWDIGFQLSYAAVLSIGIFGRPIERRWSPRAKLLRIVWQLMAVTLAAQVLTLPLVLFHFNQFPTYFLLANLVAVPLSSLILYGLLLLLPFSAFPPLATLLGAGIFYCIVGMNGFIGWVSQLPLAALTGIHLSTLQACCLFFVLALLGWWLLYASGRALVAALGGGLVFFALWQVKQVQVQQQRLLVVYNVPGKSAADLMQGARFTFMGDSALQQAGFAQNFHLQPSRTQRQVRPAGVLPLKNTLLTVANSNSARVLLLHQSLQLDASKPINVDVLVVGKGLKTKPLGVLGLVRCSTVVLDGSVSAYGRRQWQIAADSLHLRLHAVQQQGAFQLQF
jgi:competence protein ComEC